MKAKTYDSVGFPRDDGCGVFVRTVDHVEIVEYAERLRKALDEIDDLIDGEVDVRDGEDGPRPNTAMSIRSIIDALQMPERATVMRVRLPLAGRDSVRESGFESRRSSAEHASRGTDGSGGLTAGKDRQSSQALLETGVIQAARRFVDEWDRGSFEEQRLARNLLEEALEGHPTIPSRAAWTNFQRSQQVHGVWTACADAMPKPDVPVLAFVDNGKGWTRRIRATWAPRFTVESGDEDECHEYHEERDQYYLLEGWYEKNEYDENSWHVGDPVTHWMPLPAPPQAVNGAGSVSERES